MASKLYDKYFGSSAGSTTTGSTPPAPAKAPAKSKLYDKYFGDKKTVEAPEPVKKEDPKVMGPQTVTGMAVPKVIQPSQPVLTQAEPFGGMNVDRGFQSASSTTVIPPEPLRAKAQAISDGVVNHLKEWEQAKGGTDKGIRKAVATSVLSTGRLVDDIGTKGDALVSSLLSHASQKTQDFWLVKPGTPKATKDLIARQALDLAVAVSNAPSPLLETTTAGLKAIPGPTYAAGNLTEKAFSGLSTIATKISSAGVGLAEKAGVSLTPEWNETLTNVGANALLWMAFDGSSKLASSRGAKASSIRSASDMLAPMQDQLGLDHSKTFLGKTKPVDGAKLNEAYKSKLNQLASEGGPDMAAKMDIVDTAYRMTKDYAELGPQGFAQKWDPLFEQSMSVADELRKKVEAKMESSEIATKTQAVAEAVHQPLSSKTRRDLRQFDPDMQLAFESELVRLGDEKFPSIQERAAKDGVTVRNIREGLDERPAHYDIETGELRFNDAAINNVLSGLAEGKILRIGEGKQTRVFRMRDGESLGSAKKRLMDTMYDHEVAHIKTIKPEDIAALRVAKDTGDTAAFNNIRKDLEQRAESFRFEKGREISQEQFAALDESLSRTQNLEDVRAELRDLQYKSKAQEVSYREWRKTRAEPNPEFQIRFDKEVALRKQLGEAKVAYKKATPDAIRGAIERTVEREKGRMSVERTRLGDKSDVKARKLEVKLLRERILRRLEKQNLREGFAEKHKAILEERGNAQQIIKDYMIENRVPKEVRGGFIAQLKNAKNAKDAARVIEAVRDQYAKFERKESVGRIKKLIEKTGVERQASGVNKGKFTAEVQRKLDQIKRVMKEDRNKMMGKVMQDVDQFWKDNPHATELPDALAADLEIAQMAGLKTQTRLQLKNTEATIRDLMEKGKTEREFKMAERQKVDQQFVRNANQEALGYTEKPRETQADLQTIKKAVNEGVIRGWWNSSKPLGFLARNLGDTVSKLASETIGAVDRSAGRLAESGKALEAKMQSLYGKNWNDAFHRMGHDQVDLGAMPDANGKTLNVRTTKFQAMDLYNALLDKDKRQAIFHKDGNAYTQAIVDKMLSVLDDSDKAAADFVRQEYARIYPEMQRVFEERTGVPLGKVENFSGHVRWEGMQQLLAEMNPLEAVLKDADMRRLSTNPIAVKSRTGYQGTLKLSDNPFADLMQYEQRVGHYIETAEYAGRWRKLVNDQTFRDGILKTYGKEFLDGLSYHVDNIERGGLDLKKSSRIQRAFYDLSQNVSGALIANPRVWMGQLSSLPQFMGETVRLEGSRGTFTRGMRNYKGNMALLDQYVPTLKARYADTASEVVSRFGTDKGKFKRGLDKFRKGQGQITEAFDKFTTYRGASGMFESMTEFYQGKGHPLERARELAGEDVARMVADTQSTKSYLGKSRLETQTSWLQPMTALQNQPNKIAHSMVQVLDDARKGKISKARAAEYLVWTGVIQPAMYYSLRAGTTAAMTGSLYAFYKSIGADEEAEKVKANYEKKQAEEGPVKGIANAMFSNATGFLVAGDMISTIQNNIGGKNYELRPSLTDVAFDDVLNAVRQIRDGDIDEGAALSIRALSRSYGVGDPLGLINAYLASASEKNKDRKSEEKKQATKNKSLDQKIAERQSRKQKALDKKLKAAK